jgi:molybdopterin-guanine dinucleotide biosynthesis protein A
MGADKAFLKFQNSTLLERSVSNARKVADQVRVSGPRERFGPEAIEDVFPGCGPLGGIHAALRSSASELNLILAVDLPFVEAEFLRFLLHQALLHQAPTGAGEASPLAIVPRAAGGWQPLCAAYRKPFADAAERALLARHYKIDSLFSHVPLHGVEEQEILQAGFSLGVFDNLNTPEELKLAEHKSA